MSFQFIKSGRSTWKFFVAIRLPQVYIEVLIQTKLLDR